MALDISGKKKALLVGIRYTGHDTLKGTWKNVSDMKELLKTKFGFDRGNIRVLRDNQKDLPPTRKGIEEGMKWLLEDSQRNDSLVFYFVGHGSGLPDKDGDEWDYQDEYIWPVDMKSKGRICDDDLYHQLVRKLPEGCRLTAFFDCCHSGTILDLPYEFNEDGQPIKPDSESFKPLMKTEIMMPDGSFRPRPDYSEEITKEKKAKQLNVVAFSSCRDMEVALTHHNSLCGFISIAAGGYFSKNIIDILNKTPTPSYLEILQEMKQRINAKLNQTQQAQFSSGYDIDLNAPFKM